MEIVHDLRDHLVKIQKQIKEYKETKGRNATIKGSEDDETNASEEGLASNAFNTDNKESLALSARG